MEARPRSSGEASEFDIEDDVNIRTLSTMRSPPLGQSKEEVEDLPRAQGQEEETVPRGPVQPEPRDAAVAASIAASAADEPDEQAATMSPKFAVGDRVEVYWKDDEEWFPGAVVDVNFKERLYSITYDDGDEEDGVGESLVRGLVAADEQSDLLAGDSPVQAEGSPRDLDASRESSQRGPLSPEPSMSGQSECEEHGIEETLEQDIEEDLDEDAAGEASQDWDAGAPMSDEEAGHEPLSPRVEEVALPLAGEDEGEGAAGGRGADEGEGPGLPEAESGETAAVEPVEPVEPAEQASLPAGDHGELEISHECVEAEGMPLDGFDIVEDVAVPPAGRLAEGLLEHMLDATLRDMVHEEGLDVAAATDRLRAATGTEEGDEEDPGQSGGGYAAKFLESKARRSEDQVPLPGMGAHEEEQVPLPGMGTEEDDYDFGPSSLGALPPLSGGAAGSRGAASSAAGEAGDLQILVPGVDEIPEPPSEEVKVLVHLVADFDRSSSSGIGRESVEAFINPSSTTWSAFEAEIASVFGLRAQQDGQSPLHWGRLINHHEEEVSTTDQLRSLDEGSELYLIAVTFPSCHKSVEHYLDVLRHQASAPDLVGGSPSHRDLLDSRADADAAQERGAARAAGGERVAAFIGLEQAFQREAEGHDEHDIAGECATIHRHAIFDAVVEQLERHHDSPASISSVGERTLCHGASRVAPVEDSQILVRRAVESLGAVDGQVGRKAKPTEFDLQDLKRLEVAMGSNVSQHKVALETKAFELVWAHLVDECAAELSGLLHLGLGPSG